MFSVFLCTKCRNAAGPGGNLHRGPGTCVPGARPQTRSVPALWLGTAPRRVADLSGRVLSGHCAGRTPVRAVMGRGLTRGRGPVGCGSGTSTRSGHAPCCRSTAQPRLWSWFGGRGRQLSEPWSGSGRSRGRGRACPNPCRARRRVVVGAGLSWGTARRPHGLGLRAWAGVWARPDPLLQP